MATVDQTVRECIECYPGLFQSRVDVLHFVLCVIGNGYGWVDGEPVSVMDYQPEPWTVESFEADLLRNIAPDNEVVRRILLERFAEEKTEMLEILATLDERVRTWGTLEGPVYKQSDSALLMNVPGDVTADWEEACEQVRALAADNGWRF